MLQKVWIPRQGNKMSVARSKITVTLRRTRMCEQLTLEWIHWTDLKQFRVPVATRRKALYNGRGLEQPELHLVTSEMEGFSSSIRRCDVSAGGERAREPVPPGSAIRAGLPDRLRPEPKRL